MVPEIPQVTFDAAGDDKQHSIHQCAEADGDSRCSYGLNAANASVADHSGYFGQTAVSTFGIAGCPNPACESQSSTLKGQIEAAQRQMISTILQQILSSKPAEQLGPLIEVRRLLQNLLGTYNRLPCVQQQQQH
jgi:hypothetical protein